MRHLNSWVTSWEIHSLSKAQARGKDSFPILGSLRSCLALTFCSSVTVPLSEYCILTVLSSCSPNSHPCSVFDWFSLPSCTLLFDYRTHIILRKNQLASNCRCSNWQWLQPLASWDTCDIGWGDWPLVLEKNKDLTKRPFLGTSVCCRARNWRQERKKNTQPKMQWIEYCLKGFRISCQILFLKLLEY